MIDIILQLFTAIVTVVSIYGFINSVVFLVDSDFAFYKGYKTKFEIVLWLIPVVSFVAIAITLYKVIASRLSSNVDIRRLPWFNGK